MEINLDEDIYLSNYFWSLLFKSLVYSYKIEYIKHNYKNYVNSSNRWYDGQENINKLTNRGIKISHKDHKCNGDFDCNCKNKYNKKIVKENEIKYIFTGKFSLKDSYNHDLKKNNIDNQITNIDNQITNIDNKIKKLYINIRVLNLFKQIINSNLEPSDIKFVMDLDLFLHNSIGINEDHRGSDHTIIKLPFIDKKL
jgi:hypothetical protein